MNKCVLRVLLTAVICSLLAGCGFHLRNDYQLNKDLQNVVLVSQEKHSRLGKILKNRLDIFNVNVLSPLDSPGNAPTLILYPESLDRRLLSLFQTGQVAEYELIYGSRYTFIDADGKEQDYEFQLRREYQDDPDQVLAKSKELNLILDEMRRDAANRIIRQIGKI